MANSLKSQNRQLFQLFSTYLRPYWRSILILFLIYGVVTVLNAARPLIMAPVLDLALGETQSVLDNNDTEEILWTEVDLNNIGQYLFLRFGLNQLTPWQAILLLAAIYLLSTVFLHIFNFLNYLQALWIRIRSGRDIQQDLFEHMLFLPIGFYTKQRTGDLISRLDKDTQAAVAGLEQVARSFVIAPMLILFYGYMLVSTNWTLTILIVLTAVLQYIFSRAIRNQIRERVRDQFNIMAETSAYLQETIANIRIVKSFVAETYEASNLKKIIRRLAIINLRFGIFKHVDEPINQVINTFSNIIILLLAANQLLNGELTTAGFFLYLYIGSTILSPITEITQAINQVQQILAAGERVQELFAIQPEIVSGPILRTTFTNEILFEDISFQYEDDKVLQDVSFSIKRGEVVALVGPSGAGKSTLTDLLLRFYDPQEGQILFDDINLPELDVPAYRRLFGVVAQENILFNTTIEKNIAYALDDGFSTEDVISAARIANAHDFIEKLPEGYKTIVGDRGIRLSGGQRQRIAIARAMMRQPHILVMDEATSSLDSESEKQVQAAIDHVIKDTTALVIAHRLSTVIHADKIIVLEEGKIIDIGKHAQLLQRCELYQHLCKIQFEIAAEPKKE